MIKDHFKRQIYKDDFIFGENCLGLVYKIEKDDFSFKFVDKNGKVHVKKYPLSFSSKFIILEAEYLPEDDYFLLMDHKFSNEDD